MAQLLVSVRDASEARRAVAGGAHIVDVKEPNRGGLGRAEERVWQEVADVLPDSVPLSIALGELSDFRAPRRLPATARFVKLGLANAVDGLSRRSLRSALRCFPAHCQRVAVIYADWMWCNAPAPGEVLACAISLNCSAVLVDTFDKRRGDFFQHLGHRQIRSIIRDAQSLGMRAVLAGSIRRERLQDACGLGPDVIAVRGAVCRGDRTGGLDQSLVSELVAMLEPHQAQAGGAARVLPLGSKSAEVAFSSTLANFS